MIARHHDDMAAERHDPAEEAVIQLLRTVAWGTGIEHVSGDDQYVNVPVADRIRQPVEEGGKGFVAPAPVEGAPDMPVGRMQYSLGCCFHLEGSVAGLRQRPVSTDSL